MEITTANEIARKVRMTVPNAQAGSYVNPYTMRAYVVVKIGRGRNRRFDTPAEIAAKFGVI